jgi:hypothetical protein
VNTPQSPDVKLSLARRVDQLCTAFETAWKAGMRPRLEDFLHRVGAADQAGLLKELILVELYYRRKHGEEPRVEEYLERLPQHSIMLVPSPIPGVHFRPSALSTKLDREDNCNALCT